MSVARAEYLLCWVIAHAQGNPDGRSRIEAMAMDNPFIHVESADVKETFTYSDHPVAIVDVFEFGGMWNPVNSLIMFDTKTWRSMNEEEKRILLDHEIVERGLAMEDYAQYQSHSAAVGANHAKANAIISERYGAEVIEDLIDRGLLAMSESDENKLKFKMAKAEYLFEYRPESQKLILTPPESFTDVVKPPLVWNERSLNDLREKMREGVEIDPLFVDIEPKYCTITSHEGRHRAKVASELGIEEIPVLIYCRNRDRGYVNYWECEPCEFLFEKWKWKKESAIGR